MILRVTGKLGKKIKAPPQSCLPPAESPFADWSAHLFRADRCQYIMVANTPSLYSVVLRGRGITSKDELVERTLDRLQDHMARDGFGPIFDAFIAPAAEEVILSKTLNPRITGSITDLVHMARYELEQRWTPLDAVPYFVNESPVSMLEVLFPRDALRVQAAAHMFGG
jgi:hypothetical protein